MRIHLALLLALLLALAALSCEKNIREARGTAADPTSRPQPTPESM